MSDLFSPSSDRDVLTEFQEGINKLINIIKEVTNSISVILNAIKDKP